MRIVISRKGFDSGAGGKPNPILPSGRALSLPIPDYRSEVSYGDVALPSGGTLGAMVASLTRGRVRSIHPCHLDPDIDFAARPRLAGWRPAFGQVDAARSHLISKGVGPGDLFLFFGWFKEAERNPDGAWAYKRKAADLHAFYGWLQVGEIVSIDNPERIVAERPWLHEHPHMFRDASGNNAVYIASDRLAVPGLSLDLPGAGVFPALLPQHILTKPGGNRSRWSLPSWLHPRNGIPLSYHEDPARWQDDGNLVTLQSAMRGQEFVMDVTGREDHLEWLAAIMAGAGAVAAEAA
jgi:hypothetical protein